jgi:arsenic resistance protein ArsH
MRSLLSRVINLQNFNRSAVQMTSSPGQRFLGTLGQHPHLAIAQEEDDAGIRSKYRPFLLGAEYEASDWVSSLELETVTSMVQDSLAQDQARLKVLVLYGSLRKRSFIVVTIIVWHEY